MNKINIKIKSNLSINDAKNRIEALLRHEAIKYNSNSNSIISSNIPLPVINIDPRLYSKKNWIGINPFIFISAIEILLSDSETNGVTVNLNINQLRAIILYLIILALSGGVAINLPSYWGGFILFAFIAIISYVFIFIICIKTIIRKEIFNQINSEREQLN